jgi:tripartite-type tricarboxylate transporter receptor subunit TctC
VRERLAGLGVDVQSSSPEDLAKLLVNDMERWARVVQRTGIKVE